MVLVIELNASVIVLAGAVIALAVLVGVIIGAKITDKKHGVIKRWYEY